MNRQTDRWKLAACIAKLKQVEKSDIISCIIQYSKQISSIFFQCMKLSVCGKCSKISNTSCLPKRRRQTGQTQIRLLLKKQSDQGLPCLLF